MRLPKLWFLIALCILLPWQIGIVARDPWFRLPPKPIGDGPDYENIAYQLSKGRGWSMDWTDPGWRAPYEDANDQLLGMSPPPPVQSSAHADLHQQRSFAVQLARSDALAATTSRPPLLPAVIAAIYWVAGRSPAGYACVRLVLAACLAIAGALATALSAKIAGRLTSKTWPVVLAASGTLGLAMLDRTLRTYATDFLTEPLALLLVQLWLWCMCELVGVWGIENPRTSQPAARRSRMVVWASLCGILLALLIFTRSIIVLWLPAVWLLVWAGQWFRARHLTRDSNPDRDGAADKIPTGQRCALATCVVVVCALVCAPWWIRNCVVLESWMPLGTQGPTTLVGGYSDEALQHHGEWQYEPELRLRAWAEQGPAPQAGESITEREVRIARRASRLVRQWAGEHLADLPQLALMRVVNEWNPYTGRALAWKLLALAGLCWLAVAAPRAAWVLGGTLVANTLCVMVLYSVGGRFLVPLYGVLYTLAGLGLTATALGAQWMLSTLLKRNANQLH